jgi:DnaA family protein
MQLVLPVSFRKQDSFDTFVEGDNRQLISHIQQILKNPNAYPSASQRITVITGTRGAGKSHLLMATCEQANVLGLSQQYLDLAQLIKMPPEILLGLINKDVVCIDNFQVVSKHANWQTAIFDTINQFTEQESILILIASNVGIDDIDYTLKDLRTRLSWGTNFTLHLLSDEDKQFALEKHLEVLGISFTPDAVSFLLNRISRNMHELSAAIDALDIASLENKRKITIPFIKATLAI